MLELAAFADEISPDIDEQVRVCRDNGVRQIELRGAEKTNVLDFDADLRRRIKSAFDTAGLRVGCIGSPIGKVRIDLPWDEHFNRFKIAVDAAEYFGAKLIRIFSYYPPEGGDILSHRDEVIRRMRAKVDYLGDRDITVVHENEANIYGEKLAQCLDLMKTIDSPRLRSAFDFANFVQAGEKPMDNWRALKPYVKHIHIKDALRETGKNVPAGEGDGQIGPILKDAYDGGYRGLLSLEPHLKLAGQFGGMTGADLFKVAADALKKVCAQQQIPVAA